MKKNLLLLLVLWAFYPVQAQHQHPKAGLEQHRQFVHQWLQQQNHRPQVKSGPVLRSATERVIGQSTFDAFSNERDSSKITYTTSGSSVYDYNTMIYAYNYPYSTSPMFNNYQGIYTQPQVTFQRHDRWTVNPNTLVYGFYQRDLAGYDSYMNMVRDTILYADSNMYSNMIYVNSFNLVNNIEKGCWLNWNDGVADSAFKQYFEYDMSDRLVKDSMYAWHLGSWHIAAKTFYTYDGSGNLVLIDHYSNQSDTSYTAPLIEQLQYTNTYDGSGRLLTVHTNYYDGTSLAPYVKDTFAYTGSSSFHTSWREHQYDAINFTWTPQLNMVKHLNVDDLPDTVNIYSYDLMASAWVPFSRYVVSYNSENDPLQLKEYIYDFTSFPSVPDFVTTYYYEPIIVTGIGNTTEKNTTSVKVYPNPTSQTININMGASSFSTVHLTDIQGKTILPVCTITQPVFTLDLTQLEKGIYLLNLRGAGNNQVMKVIKE